jgi:hypothetical protein
MAQRTPVYVLLGSIPPRVVLGKPSVLSVLACGFDLDNVNEEL